jgi:hypothetical protein
MIEFILIVEVVSRLVNIVVNGKMDFYLKKYLLYTIRKGTEISNINSIDIKWLAYKFNLVIIHTCVDTTYL